MNVKSAIGNFTEKSIKQDCKYYSIVQNEGEREKKNQNLLLGKTTFVH